MALDEAKDPENLVRAAAETVRACPEARYVLAGKGVLEPKIKRLISELGISDKFRLLGYRKDPYGILAAVDVYTLSSKEEGMGSGQIEALAARLPIAATDAGGIGDVTKNGVNGLLVPPSDSKALAAAHIRLLRSEQTRRAMAEEGVKILLANFTSAKMAEKTLACYAAAGDLK